MSWIKTALLISLVTAFLFEISSFVATKLELFLVNKTPSLYDFGPSADDIVYGRTEREAWGAWHATSSTYRHSRSCFDVLMSFNEIGARDNSFVNLPDESIVLLGDSFAEGFGVSESDTSQYRIENELGVPVLNFGAGGSFGPLQELLIYKHYLSIPHQGLIIYVLPANDFTDNDSAVWSDLDQMRYRPYFSQEGDPLTPYYFPTATPRDTFISYDIGTDKKFVKDYFWSVNALRTALMLVRGDATIEVATDDNTLTQSYFYDANPLQQSNLIAAYEAILDLANNREVLFVIIPGQDDIARWENEIEQNSYKQQALYEGFMAFQERSQQRVSTLNLIDHLPEDTDELFLTCDGHWNPNGNQWASNIILRHIQNNRLFSSFIER